MLSRSPIEKYLINICQVRKCHKSLDLSHLGLICNNILDHPYKISICKKLSEQIITRVHLVIVFYSPQSLRRKITIYTYFDSNNSDNNNNKIYLACQCSKSNSV